MDESANLELQHRVDLYKFLLDLYTKGIAIFLAIASFVVKAALDDKLHRNSFVVMGGSATLIILIPLLFAAVHERHLRANFIRLAKATGTNPISTAPLIGLVISSLAFWLLILGIWIFLYRMSN